MAAAVTHPGLQLLDLRCAELAVKRQRYDQHRRAIVFRRVLKASRYVQSVAKVPPVEFENECVPLRLTVTEFDYYVALPDSFVGPAFYRRQGFGN